MREVNSELGSKNHSKFLAAFIEISNSKGTNQDFDVAVNIRSLLHIKMEHGLSTVGK